MTDLGPADATTALQPQSARTGPVMPVADDGTGAFRVTFRTRLREALRENRLFAAGLFLVVVFVFLAAFGRALAPYDPRAASSVISEGPSGAHWFGTDSAGLDIFSRVISAARVDISIALAATFLSVVVGSLVGLLASFFRGRTGELLMRGSDVVQAFPLLVLAIIYVTMAGRNISNIIIVVCLLNIPIYLRLVRTQVLVLRDRTFVETARANGSSELSIAVRHVLPNAVAPVWAQASITMGWAIIITAGLSFVGAGVQPPTPEWGAMIASGFNGIVRGEWWPSVFPGIAMSISVFGFAAVGEGLRLLVSER